VIRTLFVLALSGCTSTTGDSPFEPGDVDNPGTDLDSDVADTDATEDTDTGPSVDHRWFGMLQTTRSLVEDPSPLGNDTEPTDTTALMLLEWTREGTSISWNETLCGLESSEVFGTVTSFPAAFVAAIPLRTRSASLSTAETGAAFTAGPFIDVIGAKLDNPATDALPFSALDPDQWDQDADGHPGMSVHVDNNLLGEGDVYVAQRATATLSGTVLRDDRIEGSVVFDQEQVVYDASTWWLKLDTNTSADHDPAYNFFVLQGVDEGTSCADILAQQATLFGR